MNTEIEIVPILDLPDWQRKAWLADRSIDLRSLILAACAGARDLSHVTAISRQHEGKSCLVMFLMIPFQQITIIALEGPDAETLSRIQVDLEQYIHNEVTAKRFVDRVKCEMKVVSLAYPNQDGEAIESQLKIGRYNPEPKRKERLASAKEAFCWEIDPERKNLIGCEIVVLHALLADHADL